MQYTWQSQKRGMRLIVDDQHVKTVSKKLSVFINSESIENLSFERKRISDTEKKYLLNHGAYDNWLKNLSCKETLVYELIKDSKPIARRIVESPTDVRQELIFENGIKVKVPDKVFFALLKLEVTTVCLNY